MIAVLKMDLNLKQLKIIKITKEKKRNQFGAFNTG